MGVTSGKVTAMLENSSTGALYWLALFRPPANIFEKGPCQ